VITTNLQGHYHEFYDVYRSILVGLGKSNYLENLAVNEKHRGAPELACRLIENAGFKMTKVISDEFQMRFLDGTSLLNHVLTKIGFLDGWYAVVNEKDRDQIFSALEKELNHIASSQSCLTMTVPMLYLEANAT
jgi:hypothetical protein